MLFRSALIKCYDLALVHRSRLEVAATWLALGLDTEKSIFYRQSDIPEIPELTWILTCMTAKGLMNRAHAYKAAVQENEADDPDKGVTMRDEPRFVAPRRGCDFQGGCEIVFGSRKGRTPKRQIFLRFYQAKDFKHVATARPV